MLTETRAQFARRLGVNRSTITRAIQTGRLIVDGSDNILVEESLTRWHESKGGRADVEARHAKNRGAVIPEAGQGQKDATAARKSATTAQQGESNTVGTRVSYKTIALEFENAAIKLEMALRRGTRFPLDDVKREAYAIGGTLRAALERLIDQTAPRLAVMRDKAARQRLLIAECRGVARVINGEFPRALRRLKKGQGKGQGSA